jgi:hypothetical protein
VQKIINMTQTSKKPNRRLTLVLAALLAASLVGLNIAITVYYSEMNVKNSEIQQLNDQLSSIEAQIANLTLTTSAANLISVPSLHFTDNRTNPAAPFLQVTGYIVNVGTAKATDCGVHVYAIQAGNNTAIDGTKPINALEPGSYEAIDIQFPYSGQPLTAYSSNLDWTK